MDIKYEPFDDDIKYSNYEGQVSTFEKFKDFDIDIKGEIEIKEELDIKGETEIKEELDDTEPYPKCDIHISKFEFDIQSKDGISSHESRNEKILEEFESKQGKSEDGTRKNLKSVCNYEKQIFEQVIDNYLNESQKNFIPTESNLNSLNFKIKSKSSTLKTSGTKDENFSKKVNNDNAKKRRESKSKAVLIEAEYHENLPKGWKKVVVQRTTGATAGKYDVYFFTPSGRKLRSKNEIKDYSEKNNLDLDLTTFGFSRPKRDVNKTPNKKLKSSKPQMQQSPIEKEADSGDTSYSIASTDCLSKASTDNSDTVDNSCVEIDNIFRNIEEEIKSLTDVSDIPVVLDLPNTSFSKSNKFSDLDNKSVSSTDDEIYLDQNHLGKIFKIERPLSFSCF